MVKKIECIHTVTDLEALDSEIKAIKDNEGVVRVELDGVKLKERIPKAVKKAREKAQKRPKKETKAESDIDSNETK